MTNSSGKYHNVFANVTVTQNRAARAAVKLQSLRGAIGGDKCGMIKLLPGESRTVRTSAASILH